MAARKTQIKCYLQNMVHRQLASYINSILSLYPAIAIIGPRQCDKTTLARTLSPLYFDLEEESDLLRLDIEWEGLISTKKPIILDEAQTVPQIFKRLRAAIIPPEKARKRSVINAFKALWR